MLRAGPRHPGTRQSVNDMPSYRLRGNGRFHARPSKKGAVAGVHKSIMNKDRDHIRYMFDAIAFRYDFVNRALSLRRDVAWRKAMVTALPEGRDLRVLDLATGTGDVTLAIRKARPCARVIGADVAREMLRLSQKKNAPSGSPGGGVVQADAAVLCWRESAFDVVTVAFGVRNFTELDAGLREMHRVLRPGGTAIILEFSLPANGMLRAAYLLYFRHLLPRIAGLLSRQPDAYRYLNRSVEAFPYGQDFCDLLRAAGFENIAARPLTLGIATLYTGRKG